MYCRRVKMAKWDFALLVLMSSPVLGANSPPLESYNIDTSRITVSGLSAGGCFATQVFKKETSSLVCKVSNFY